MVRIGVLGPVKAWSDAGIPAPLRGPRHREVLGRLVAARGRTVAATTLVADLWDEGRTPADGLAAVRTFVSALRRALEPDRPPRRPARLLVTDGPGYALRLPDHAVDARRLEAALSDTRGATPGVTLARLDEALDLWRGTPYAGIEASWARAERARLSELRLTAVERRADALVALGRGAEAVAELDGHVAAHPWREEGWRLLALGLYRSARQADALAVLRRARTVLADELGVDPGPALAQLETRLLRHEAGTGPGDVWADVTDAYAHGPGTRARLEASADLLRTLAVAGGLTQARDQRLVVVHAAEQLGDPGLTARVLTAYDVPGTWSRSDDPAQAAEIAAAAERTLAALPADAPGSLRARLYAVVATETRGLRGERGLQAAREAVNLARAAADPGALLAALAAQALQAVDRAGLAPVRDAIGAEALEIAERHGSSTGQILGHLLRMQARGAIGDLDGAGVHADEAAALGRRHERPLVEVLVEWFGAMRLGIEGAPLTEVDRAYHGAARGLAGAGMPGMEKGLLPLALLCLRVARMPAHAGPADVVPDALAGLDAGPYSPWTLPWRLLATGRRHEADAAVRRLPEPPPGLLLEALWVLAGRAAIAVGSRAVAERARHALAPAAAEIAGAGSATLTAGPVAAHLAALEAFLADDPA